MRTFRKEKTYIKKNRENTTTANIYFDVFLCSDPLSDTN